MDSACVSTWRRGVMVAHRTGNLEARVQVPADAKTFSSMGWFKCTRRRSVPGSRGAYVGFGRKD